MTKKNSLASARTSLKQLRLIAYCLVCAANVLAQQHGVATTVFVPNTDYSKEAFVIEKFSREIVFTAEGTWQKEQSATVRIQSEAGVRGLGVLSFAYNGGSERVDLSYVRVRKPDGKIVITPNDNVQDISSELTKAVPTYTDLREKQIPVRSLGVGDVLEYKVRIIHTTPDIEGQFWYSQNFLTGAVVLQETLKIVVPAGKYVKVSSPSLAPEVHHEQTLTTYFWKTSQLQATPQQTPKNEQSASASLPSVQMTTFHDWDEIGRWFGRLEASRVVVTPAVQAKADELTKGLTTYSDKQRTIYNYVATKFRYISVSFGLGRYQPHAAAEVLANQYGDCKDKHTLFAALLKAEGIEAWPALIGIGIKLDPTMPSLAPFNHVITVLPKGQNRIWLDTTPEVAPYGLLQQALRDHQALVIPNSGPAVLMTTPADPPFSKSELVQVNATLSAQGTLTAHFDITLRGDSELELRSAFHQLAPAQWQPFVQNMSYALGYGGDVSNINLDNLDNLDRPLHYSYDYSRENYSDWSNRRITPPFPPMSFLLGPDASKPVDPIELGAPGEIVYRATIHLPQNYSVEIPASVNVHAKFADYSAQYSMVGGTLSAERHMKVTASKVPVEAWTEYQTFEKKVTGEEKQYIQLAAAAGKSITVVVQNNPEAESLVRQAFQSIQAKDLNAAADELKAAERLNPKQHGLWAAYGYLYLTSHDFERGIAAYKKEVQNFPDNVDMYLSLAEAQARYRHPDDAIQTLRDLVKIAPDNIPALTRLASLLMTRKQYAEVTELIQKPAASAPEKSPLHSLLIEALLRQGRKDEGIAAAKSYAAKSSDPTILNDAAYFLADTNADLALAKECAQKAVIAIENESKNVTLTSLTDDDLRHVSQLASTWDTLGWVYFRLGDLAQAERYIKAAWNLSQQAVMADHLGQIYEAQKKREAAIHAWQLALATNSGLAETRERLRKLGAPEKPVLRTKKQGSKTIWPESPQEELGHLRTIKITDLPKQEGSAEFFVLFADGHIVDTKYISGAEKLKNASVALLKVPYIAPIPDNGLEKIVRRGILSCSTYTSPSCQFVMYLPATTRRD